MSADRQIIQVLRDGDGDLESVYLPPRAEVIGQHDLFGTAQDTAGNIANRQNRGGAHQPHPNRLRVCRAGISFRNDQTWIMDRFDQRFDTHGWVSGSARMRAISAVVLCSGSKSIRTTR